MLQADYERGTKDGDVLQTAHLAVQQGSACWRSRTREPLYTSVGGSIST